MGKGYQKRKQTRTFEKCRDELVKEVWGQGRDGVCSRMNIHKPRAHPHPPYTFGV